MNFTDLTTEKIGMTEIKIPYNTAIFQPTVISMPAIEISGKLTMMVMAVQYMVNRKNRVEMLDRFKKTALWSSLGGMAIKL